MKGEGARRNAKCLAYVATFVVFQTVIILVFALTVMKIKGPKLRFRAVGVESFSNGNTNSSFNMRLRAEVAVKNTNFGHFKYENSTVNITYGGVTVGQAIIPKGRAKARATKRFEMELDISSDQLSGNANLGNDMNSGVLPLASQARLPGKVHLMKLIKKKKTAEMYCTMAVNLATRAVLDLKCK